MIGLFDSGLGGLGVVREVRALLPNHDLLYLADRARAPYGRRELEEVRRFSREITRHLLGEGASIVVVACNSASAVALNHLRELHPAVPFVGMEPAVKPAIAATRRGTIGVLATAATFQGELFASLIDRYGNGAEILTRVCDGWVELVERGVLDGDTVEAEVRRHVEPILAGGADTLVLGCTHYPFLGPVIRRVAGPDIEIIDPARAVARQVARVVAELPGNPGSGQLKLQVTGSLTGVPDVVAELVGLAMPMEAVTLPAHV